MLSISNLHIKFRNEIVFENFSLNIKSGEKIALSGKSGKGKSTLLNLTAGFMTDYKGDVKVFGLELNTSNIKEIRKKIAWLPQNTSLNTTSVHDLFYTPFDFIINKEKTPNKDQISEIFNQFELSEDLLNKNVKEISGGQKQRILIAACILLRKPLLIIDEPTSALDDQIKKKVADYILGIKNMTVIAATHDEYWMQQSDRVIHLS